MAAGAAPAGSERERRIVVLLHGILGSKANWNTPARRLLEHVGPLGWDVLQLDLRAHGRSPEGRPPHSLEACALDVRETLEGLGLQPGGEGVVVCGHSFGGKVALALLQAQLRAGGPPPRATWLLDSVPGRPAAGSAVFVASVLQAVERVAGDGARADRAALVEALLAQGLEPATAQWLAQSVRRAAGGLELAHNTQVLRALHAAYCHTDLWSVLEGGNADIGVVVAGRNRHAWGQENLERLNNCGERVRVVTLEGAGHNVHVDDLPGLLEALRPTFT